MGTKTQFAILFILSSLFFIVQYSSFVSRKDEEALVYDMAPNPNEIKIGTRVIAHWSGVAAYLPGAVTKIEGAKYHVLYDDGDRLSNRLEQMRILKPPLYFGELLLSFFSSTFSHKRSVGCVDVTFDSPPTRRRFDATIQLLGVYKMIYSQGRI